MAEVNRDPVGGPPTGVFGGDAERVEIVGMRTQTSRTFQTDFGAMETEVFPGSIHYRAGDGWRPIDNTLEPAGQGFANRANAYRVQLPRVLGAAPVRLNVGNDFVAMDLEADGGRPATTDESEATYEDVLPGVDARYTALNDSIKEDLLLESAGSTTEFTWRLSTSPSLSAKTNERGGVDFVSADGSIPMAIPAPVIYDAAGLIDGLAPPHRFELVEGDGWDELHLVVDDEWLSAPERTFPVTVDPTIDIWGPTGASRDCYISDAQQTTSFCGASQLYVGKYSGVRTRSLLRFDVSSIPNSADILAGSVGMFLEGATQSASNQLAARELTRDFVNGETDWTRNGFYSNWNNPGGDFSDKPADGFVKTDMNDRAEWKHWFITRTVKDWVAKGASANQGVIVKVDNESTAIDQRFTFTAMDSSDLARPRLRIIWDNGGVGSLSTYKTEDKKLTGRRTQKVNVASGNLLIRETDLKIRGTGLDLTIDRYYNSLVQNEKTTTTSQLGTGWTLTNSGDIGLRLLTDEASGAPGKEGSVTTTSVNGAIFFGPSGYRVPFTRESTTGDFKRPPGINADLKQDGADQWTLTYRDTEERYVFQNGGMLVSHKDKNGNKIEFFYDVNNRLTSLRDTQGRVTTFTYNANGMLSSIKDPANRSHQFGYTAAQDHKLMTTYTDPADFVTTYGYDLSKRLTSITDPEGHQTLYAYDANNRVTKVTYVTNKTTTPPTGDATTFEYFSTPDGNRCPAHSKVPGTELGLSTVVTDARNNKTTYCYNGSGNVGLVKDAKNNRTYAKYDSMANVTNLIDARSREFGFTYDSTGGATDGNLVQATSPSSDTSGVTAKTSKVEYKDDRHPGMPTASVDAQGNRTEYTYDGRGNVTCVTLAAGTSEAVNFRYAYHSVHGGITRVSRPPEPGCLQPVDDSTRDNDILFQYDTVGNMIGIDYPQMRWWPNHYPVPSQAGDRAFGYDGLSRVTTATDGHGRLTSFEYDVLDHTYKTRYTYNSNVATTWLTFDKIHNVVERLDYAQNANVPVETEYKFDLKNQMVEERQLQPTLRTIGYEYDVVGNLKKITKGNDVTTFAYDEVNLPSQLTDPDGLITRFDYDQTYRRTKIVYPNDTTVHTTYNHMGDVWKVEAYKSAVTDPLVKLEYVYDRTASGSTADQGLIQKVVDHRTGEQTAFTYDKLNRLTHATRSNGGVIDQFVYAYDQNSNITRSSKYTGGTASAGGTKVREAEMTYGDFQELLRCRRVVATSEERSNTCHSAASPDPTIDYYYDAAGNMLQGVAPGADVSAPASVTFSYDVKNHTSHVAKPDGQAAFSYVGPTQAERVSKTGVSSEYDLIGLERDKVGSDVVRYLRDNKGLAIGQTVTSGTTTQRRYYVRDNLGSVVAITNGAGEVTKRYAYEPYGKTTSTGPDNIYQPWRWAQGYFDTETGLYKLGQRYYDPLLHRFTQVDPEFGNLMSPMTLNPYLYAGGNPINFIDPTGRFWDEIAAVAIGAAVGGAVMGLTGNALVAQAAGGCAAGAAQETFDGGDGTEVFIHCLVGAASTLVGVKVFKDFDKLAQIFRDAF